MAVTELALLKLKNGGTLTQDVKAQLKKAQVAMESYSGGGRKFHYLQQVEDPTCIYVLGEWESLSQHYDGFIPSKANQDLLEALKDELDVGWLSHLDVPVSKIQLDAPVLSIGRHMIKDGTYHSGSLKPLSRST
jgi:quinol monooxygenase YgiN